MAYGFNGSNQYLQRTDTCGISGTGFSIGCWFKTPSSNADFIFGLCDSASYSQFLLYDNGNRYLYAYEAGTAAVASAQFSNGTWHHALGVSIHNTSRAVYLDGANKGTSGGATSVWPGPTLTEVAHRTKNNNYWAGQVAWASIWNAVLTDADAAALGKGIHPTLVKPQNLVAFWPLGGLDPQDPKDRWGGYDLTAYNSPTEEEHPAGLLYPQGPQIVAPGTAPPASSVPWHLMIGSAV